jgi:transposase
VSRFTACAGLTGSRCSRAKPFAHADPRAVLLDTIPGIAELLAPTIAVEIGDIGHFATPKPAETMTRGPSSERPLRFRTRA